jgi:uncharacterized phage protein (TIGR02220 family)
MLWFYILDDCDHAGIWKPNIKVFEAFIRGQVDLNLALSKFNSNKPRVEVLLNGRWFVKDFIYFQYGSTLNLQNRVHNSIYQLLNYNEVNLDSLRPQIEVKEGVKDKDKDKDKDKESKEDVGTLQSPKLSPQSPKEDIPYKEIVDYLNEKLSTPEKQVHYRATSKDTREHISARWREGYRVPDFKKCIDNMIAKWKNDQKYCQYLRPATLFAEGKFDGYVNQIITQKEKDGVFL